MTNAHVVAGTSTLQAQQSDGTSYDADVVLFDSVNDVAILRVDGIDARPLRFASSTASTGDDAIVLGYPQAGPFQATAVRVRDMRELPTANIYRNRQVTREVYTVRGVIRQGNSGGPMLNSAGDVLAWCSRRRRMPPTRPATSSPPLSYSRTSPAPRDATDGCRPGRVCAND